jgi:hypothetical protein
MPKSRIKKENIKPANASIIGMRKNTAKRNAILSIN